MELDPSLGNPARARKGKQRATTCTSQESKEDDSQTRELGSDIYWENLTETAGRKETMRWRRRVVGMLCHLLHFAAL